MQMVRSFYKILLDPSAPHLPLPPAFVSKHLADEIPNSPVIQSENGGYSWKVKIKQIGETYCFVDGWMHVVNDIQLGFGNVLVFRLVDESIFKLIVYSPDGCEKILTQKSQGLGGGVDKIGENGVDEIGGNGGDEEEKEDGADDDYDSDEDDSDEDDNGEDDVDEDDDDEVYGDDEEKDGDNNGADPSFVSTMTRANTKILRFPVSFMKAARIRAEGTMMLRNLEGKEWEMGVKLDKSFRQSERYLLSSGWCGFRRKNNLLQGDKCLFTFIKSEKKLLLAKVTKKIWPEEKPPLSSVKAKRGQERGGDVDVEERGLPRKRPRGKPPQRYPEFDFFDPF